MRDILPPKGMHSELRDVFRFWEISHNISEMVHDRDIVAMEDSYCMWPIKWHHCQRP